LFVKRANLDVTPPGLSVEFGGPSDLQNPYGVAVFDEFVGCNFGQ